MIGRKKSQGQLKRKILKVCKKIATRKKETPKYQKTKTSTILDKLKLDQKRKPKSEILLMTKNETKTIITARYGMLECGRNFKGTHRMMCDQCNQIDDENHRLNNCVKWKKTNFHNTSEKLDFQLVYSNDIDILRGIIAKLDIKSGITRQPMEQCAQNSR